jgi:predicted metalloendopeptidase
MNPEVKPGDNFFRYANGTWLKKQSVPPSKTRGEVLIFARRKQQAFEKHY